MKRPSLPAGGSSTTTVCSWSPPAVSLSPPVYDNSPLLGDASTVLVVVCGGIGISAAKLRDMETRIGL